jgi:hypothetical protein
MPTPAAAGDSSSGSRAPEPGAAGSPGRAGRDPEGIGRPPLTGLNRRELPPRPRWDGRGLEGGRPGSTGRDPAPPGTRTGQTRVELQTHRLSQTTR